MNLNEPQPLPESFRETHYCTDHVMAALEMSEPEFWANYVSGAIPRGVSLMMFGIPLVVWPKYILDDWNNNGRPPEPGALELQNEVLHSLKDAYAREGCVFPDQLHTLN